MHSWTFRPSEKRSFKDRLRAYMLPAARHRSRQAFGLHDRSSVLWRKGDKTRGLQRGTRLWTSANRYRPTRSRMQTSRLECVADQDSGRCGGHGRGVRMRGALEKVSVRPWFSGLPPIKKGAPNQGSSSNPDQGAYRTALGRRPRSGARFKLLLLYIQGRSGPGWSFLRKQFLDARASIQIVSGALSRPCIVSKISSSEKKRLFHIGMGVR